MIRKIMVPFLAAAAMLAGSAIATAQDSHPNDFVASDRAFSGPFYDSPYRVSPYQYPDVTTGYATAPVIVAPAPLTTDDVIYSYGSSRLCSSFDYARGLC